MSQHHTPAPPPPTELQHPRFFFPPARTPSRFSSPATPRSSSPTTSWDTPTATAAPSSSKAPPTSSPNALQDLAAWVATNYMGMGKSAADALPELRRRQVTALGDNTYSVAGSVMDAAGIAQALRLMVRLRLCLCMHSALKATLRHSGYMCCIALHYQTHAASPGAGRGLQHSKLI